MYHAAWRPLSGVWGIHRSSVTRSVHLHCIRNPTNSQIELFFRNVFPANFCLHCGPYMTQITLKNMATKARSAKRSPASFVRFPQPFSFPRWFRPHADRRWDRPSRETILKIAQSGHRLYLRLSMGDGRSGLLAPGRHCFWYLRDLWNFSWRRNAWLFKEEALLPLVAQGPDFQDGAV